MSVIWEFYFINHHNIPTRTYQCPHCPRVYASSFGLVSSTWIHQRQSFLHSAGIMEDDGQPTSKAKKIVYRRNGLNYFVSGLWFCDFGENLCIKKRQEGQKKVAFSRLCFTFKFGETREDMLNWCNEKFNVRKRLLWEIQKCNSSVKEMTAAF